MPTTKKLSGYTGDFQEAAEYLKEQGNEHFKAKKFFASVKSYSLAIDIDDSNHVYYGNRSAAYGAIGDWQRAADDARVCVGLNSGYTKGFYRLAQALLAIGDTAEAASATESGLSIDPANKAMLSLKRKISGGSSRTDPGGAKTVPKKPTGTVQLERLSLYDDKESPEKSPEQGGPDADAQALKGIFRSLKDSVTAPNKSLGAGRAHELEGIFQKLTDPEQFRRTVMCGLHEDEREDAPSSLQELLRSSLYSAAVEASLPRVVVRAASVLGAVKERAMKAGEIMDAATEEILKPQVLQEAFAREVIHVVSAVNAEARAKAAKERGKLASPSCEQASWDQLDSDTVMDLLQEGKGFAVQDSFLGEEWVSVLLEDSVRFQGTGKLGLREIDREHGEMAWVEPAQLEYGYPALHELVVNIHALAFELNLKDPRLRLSHPFRGATMLVRFSEGCRYPEHLDSFVESAVASSATGYRVSAAYFVGRRRRPETTPKGESQGVPQGRGADSGGGGELKLRNVEKDPVVGVCVHDSRDGNSGSRAGEERSGDSTPSQTASGGQKEAGAEGGGRDSSLSAGPSWVEEVPPAGRSVVVEPKADRLVLFRSDRVSNQTLQVVGQGQEQYMLLFWMHGVKEDDEEVQEGKSGSSAPSGDDGKEGVPGSA